MTETIEERRKIPITAARPPIFPTRHGLIYIAVFEDKKQNGREKYQYHFGLLPSISLRMWPVSKVITDFRRRLFLDYFFIAYSTIAYVRQYFATASPMCMLLDFIS